jgi:SAM-dependent methyltransferase
LPTEYRSPTTGLQVQAGPLFLVYKTESLIYNCIVVDITKSYSNHPLHAEVGGIIRTHSENKTDIRSVAKRMIEWKNVQRIIDLGCGYGWFEEALEESTDLIVGVDYLIENAHPFIQNAKKTAKEAIFKTCVLPETIDFPSGYFDLVVCAYSLYFFPGILPEVKRILRDGGTFIVITHSESMLEEGKEFFDFKNLRTVIEEFSAENGESILRKHFQHIISVDYHNSLIFHKGDERDLAFYIDFKREFIKKDADPDLVRETLLGELFKKGEFCLNKNDKIFLVKK